MSSSGGGGRRATMTTSRSRNVSESSESSPWRQAELDESTADSGSQSDNNNNPEQLQRQQQQQQQLVKRKKKKRRRKNVYDFSLGEHKIKMRAVEFCRRRRWEREMIRVKLKDRRIPRVLLARCDDERHRLRPTPVTVQPKLVAREEEEKEERLRLPECSVPAKVVLPGILKEKLLVVKINKRQTESFIQSRKRLLQSQHLASVSQEKRIVDKSDSVVVVMRSGGGGGGSDSDKCADRLTEKSESAGSSDDGNKCTKNASNSGRRATVARIPVDKSNNDRLPDDKLLKDDSSSVGAATVGESQPESSKSFVPSSRRHKRNSIDQSSDSRQSSADDLVGSKPKCGEKKGGGSGDERHSEGSGKDARKYSKNSIKDGERHSLRVVDGGSKRHAEASGNSDERSKSLAAKDSSESQPEVSRERSKKVSKNLVEGNLRPRRNLASKSNESHSEDSVETSGSEGTLGQRDDKLSEKMGKSIQDSSKSQSEGQKIVARKAADKSDGLAESVIEDKADDGKRCIEEHSRKLSKRLDKKINECSKNETDINKRVARKDGEISENHSGNLIESRVNFLEKSVEERDKLPEKLVKSVKVCIENQIEKVIRNKKVADVKSDKHTEHALESNLNSTKDVVDKSNNSQSQNVDKNIQKFSKNSNENNRRTLRDSEKVAYAVEESSVKHSKNFDLKVTKIPKVSIENNKQLGQSVVNKSNDKLVVSSIENYLDCMPNTIKEQNKIPSNIDKESKKVPENLNETNQRPKRRLAGKSNETRSDDLTENSIESTEDSVEKHNERLTKILNKNIIESKNYKKINTRRTSKLSERRGDDIDNLVEDDSDHIQQLNETSTEKVIEKSNVNIEENTKIQTESTKRVKRKSNLDSAQSVVKETDKELPEESKNVKNLSKIEIEKKMVTRKSSTIQKEEHAEKFVESHSNSVHTFNQDSAQIFTKEIEKELPEESKTVKNNSKIQVDKKMVTRKTLTLKKEEYAEKSVENHSDAAQTSVPEPKAKLSNKLNHHSNENTTIPSENNKRATRKTLSLTNEEHAENFVENHSDAVQTSVPEIKAKLSNKLDHDLKDCTKIPSENNKRASRKTSSLKNEELAEKLVGSHLDTVQTSIADSAQSSAKETEKELPESSKIIKYHSKIQVEKKIVTRKSSTLQKDEHAEKFVESHSDAVQTCVLETKTKLSNKLDQDSKGCTQMPSENKRVSRKSSTLQNDEPDEKLVDSCIDSVQTSTADSAHIAAKETEKELPETSKHIKNHSKIQMEKKMITRKSSTLQKEEHTEKLVGRHSDAAQTSALETKAKLSNKLDNDSKDCTKIPSENNKRASRKTLTLQKEQHYEKSAESHSDSTLTFVQDLAHISAKETEKELPEASKNVKNHLKIQTEKKMVTRKSSTLQKEEHAEQLVESHSDSAEPLIPETNAKLSNKLDRDLKDCTKMPSENNKRASRKTSESHSDSALTFVQDLAHISAKETEKELPEASKNVKNHLKIQTEKKMVTRKSSTLQKEEHAEQLVESHSDSAEPLIPETNAKLSNKLDRDLKDCTKMPSENNKRASRKTSESHSDSALTFVQDLAHISAKETEKELPEASKNVKNHLKIQTEKKMVTRKSSTLQKEEHAEQLVESHSDSAEPLIPETNAKLSNKLDRDLKDCTKMPSENNKRASRKTSESHSDSALTFVQESAHISAKETEKELPEASKNVKNHLKIQTEKKMVTRKSSTLQKEEHAEQLVESHSDSAEPLIPETNAKLSNKLDHDLKDCTKMPSENNKRASRKTSTLRNTELAEKLAASDSDSIQTYSPDSPHSFSKESEKELEASKNVKGHTNILIEKKTITRKTSTLKSVEHAKTVVEIHPEPTQNTVTETKAKLLNKLDHDSKECNTMPSENNKRASRKSSTFKNKEHAEKLVEIHANSVQTSVSESAQTTETEKELPAQSDNVKNHSKIQIENKMITRRTSTVQKEENAENSLESCSAPVQYFNPDSKAKLSNKLDQDMECSSMSSENKRVARKLSPNKRERIFDTLKASTDFVQNPVAESTFNLSNKLDQNMECTNMPSENNKRLPRKLSPDKKMRNTETSTKTSLDSVQNTVSESTDKLPNELDQDIKEYTKMPTENNKRVPRKLSPDKKVRNTETSIKISLGSAQNAVSESIENLPNELDQDIKECTKMPIENNKRVPRKSSLDKKVRNTETSTKTSLDSAQNTVSVSTEKLPSELDQDIKECTKMPTENNKRVSRKLSPDKKVRSTETSTKTSLDSAQNAVFESTEKLPNELDQDIKKCTKMSTENNKRVPRKLSLDKKVKNMEISIISPDSAYYAVSESTAKLSNKLNLDMENNKRQVRKLSPDKKERNTKTLKSNLDAVQNSVSESSAKLSKKLDHYLNEYTKMPSENNKRATRKSSPDKKERNAETLIKSNSDLLPNAARESTAKVSNKLNQDMKECSKLPLENNKRISRKLSSDKSERNTETLKSNLDSVSHSVPESKSKFANKLDNDMECTKMSSENSKRVPRKVSADKNERKIETSKSNSDSLPSSIEKSKDFSKITIEHKMVTRKSSLLDNHERHTEKLFNNNSDCANKTVDKNKEKLPEESQEIIKACSKSQTENHKRVTRKSSPDKHERHAENLAKKNSECVQSAIEKGEDKILDKPQIRIKECLKVQTEIYKRVTRKSSPDKQERHTENLIVINLDSTRNSIDADDEILSERLDNKENSKTQIEINSRITRYSPLKSYRHTKNLVANNVDCAQTLIDENKDKSSENLVSNVKTFPNTRKLRKNSIDKTSETDNESLVENSSSSTQNSIDENNDNHTKQPKDFIENNRRITRNLCEKNVTEQAQNTTESNLSNLQHSLDSRNEKLLVTQDDKNKQDSVNLVSETIESESQSESTAVNDENCQKSLNDSELNVDLSENTSIVNHTDSLVVANEICTQTSENVELEKEPKNDAEIRSEDLAEKDIEDVQNLAEKHGKPLESIVETHYEKQDESVPKIRESESKSSDDSPLRCSRRIAEKAALNKNESQPEDFTQEVTKSTESAIPELDANPADELVENEEHSSIAPIENDETLSQSDEEYEESTEVSCDDLIADRDFESQGTTVDYTNEICHEDFDESIKVFVIKPVQRVQEDTLETSFEDDTATSIEPPIDEIPEDDFKNLEENIEPSTIEPVEPIPTVGDLIVAESTKVTPSVPTEEIPPEPTETPEEPATLLPETALVETPSLVNVPETLPQPSSLDQALPDSFDALEELSLTERCESSLLESKNKCPESLERRLSTSLEDSIESPPPREASVLPATKDHGGYDKNSASSSPSSSTSSTNTESEEDKYADSADSDENLADRLAQLRSLDIPPLNSSDDADSGVQTASEEQQQRVEKIVLKCPRRSFLEINQAAAAAAAVESDFRCKDCDEAFASSRELKKHVKVQHRQRLVIKILKTDENKHVTHMVEPVSHPKASKQASKEQEDEEEDEGNASASPEKLDEDEPSQITEGEIKIIVRKEAGSRNSHVVKEIKITPKSASSPATLSDFGSGCGSSRIPYSSPARSDLGSSIGGGNSCRIPGSNSPPATIKYQEIVVTAAPKRRGRPRKYPIFTEAEIIAKTFGDEQPATTAVDCPTPVLSNGAVAPQKKSQPMDDSPFVVGDIFGKRNEGEPLFEAVESIVVQPDFILDNLHNVVVERSASPLRSRSSAPAPEETFTIVNRPGLILKKKPASAEESGARRKRRRTLSQESLDTAELEAAEAVVREDKRRRLDENEEENPAREEEEVKLCMPQRSVSLPDLRAKFNITKELFVRLEKMDIVPKGSGEEGNDTDDEEAEAEAETEAQVEAAVEAEIEAEAETLAEAEVEAEAEAETVSATEVPSEVSEKDSPIVDTTPKNEERPRRKTKPKLPFDEEQEQQERARREPIRAVIRLNLRRKLENNNNNNNNVVAGANDADAADKAPSDDSSPSPKRAAKSSDEIETETATATATETETETEDTEAAKQNPEAATSKDACDSSLEISGNDTLVSFFANANPVSEADSEAETEAEATATATAASEPSQQQLALTPRRRPVNDRAEADESQKAKLHVLMNAATMPSLAGLGAHQAQPQLQVQMPVQPQLQLQVQSPMQLQAQPQMLQLQQTPQQFCILFFPDSLYGGDMAHKDGGPPTATIVNFQPVPDNEIANKPLIYVPTTPSKISHDEHAKSYVCATCTEVTDLIGRLEASLGMTEEDKSAIKCPYCSNHFQSLFYLEYHVMQEHLKCENEKQCRHSGFNSLKIPTHEAASEFEIYITFALKCRSCYDIFNTVLLLNDHVMHKHKTLVRVKPPSPLPSGPSSSSASGNLTSYPGSPFARKNGGRVGVLQCPSDCVCRIGIRSGASALQRQQMLKRCPNAMRRLEKIEPAAYEVYTCTLCKSTFLMKDEVVDHLMKMHEVSCKFPCYTCLTSFRSLQMQERHRCSETTLQDFDKLLSIAILPVNVSGNSAGKDVNDKYLDREDSSNDEYGSVKASVAPAGQRAPVPVSPAAPVLRNGLKRKNGSTVAAIQHFLGVSAAKKAKLANGQASASATPSAPVSTGKHYNSKRPCPRCPKRFAYRKSLHDHIIYEHLLKGDTSDRPKRIATELLRLISMGRANEQRTKDLAEMLKGLKDEDAKMLRSLILEEDELVNGEEGGENGKEAEAMEVDSERDVAQCVRCKASFKHRANSGHNTRQNNQHQSIDEAAKLQLLCESCENSGPKTRRRTIVNGHHLNNASASSASGSPQIPQHSPRVVHPYACKHCPNTFPSPMELKFHKRNIHAAILNLKSNSDSDSNSSGKQLHACDVCKKTFGSSRMLDKHKKLHREAVILDESTTSSTTSSKTTSATEDENTCSSPIVGPADCNASKDNASLGSEANQSLNEAANSSSRRDSSDSSSAGSKEPEEQPLDCSFCEEVCSSKVSLKNHLKREHGRRASICQFCNGLLIDTSEVRHMLDYHIVPSCKSATRRATIVKHNGSVLQCEASCMQEDVEELVRTLGKHRLRCLMMYHDFEGKCNNAIMRCPLCPELFATRESCRYHYVWVHDDTCLLCDEQFRSGSSAFQHKVDAHTSTASYLWCIQRLVTAIVHTLRLDADQPSHVLHQMLSIRLEDEEQAAIQAEQLITRAKSSGAGGAEKPSGNEEPANIATTDRFGLEAVVLSEDQLPDSSNMIEVVIGKEDSEDDLLSMLNLSPNYESCEQSRIPGAGDAPPEEEDEDDSASTTSAPAGAASSVPTTPTVTTSAPPTPLVAPSAAAAPVPLLSTPTTTTTTTSSTSLPSASSASPVQESSGTTTTGSTSINSYVSSGVCKYRLDNDEEQLVLVVTDEDLVTFRDDIGSLAERISATCDSLTLDEISEMLRAYFDSVNGVATPTATVTNGAVA